MYESKVSVFSSKWNDCHKWNNCSLLFPIFEYCCLNWFCKPCQSTFIGLEDSYHNLDSLTNVKQNLWTFTPSWNWCVPIQSFILSKCASASSSGFPENSALKCDQFNCGMCCIGCTVCGGACSTCGAWGAGIAWSNGSADGACKVLYV